MQLHKQGQNLFGLCPFVPENTPSFSVNESKQIFNCFSCHRGGNVFKFVQEYEHLSFPEAVAKVAEFANIPLGVTITPQRQEAPEITNQKAILRQVTDMMHHLLVNTTSGEAALAYLTKRGLTQATIDHFEIGYVPGDRQLMKKFLDNREVSYDDQRQSGLFAEDDQGQLYDRFNDRVMFPLKDQYGDVIGFSGRVLDAQASQAKYLNSPETQLFNKSEVLFNLDQAKNQFKDNGGAVLFEGFMDVISAYQAGVPTGVASMGTSLTTEQVNIIAKQTRHLTICYDGDAPGQHAADRALGLIGNQPRLEVGVVVLPEGQDPDEYIKAHDAEAFQKQLKHTLTPIGFRLAYLAQDRDLSSDQAKLDYIDAGLKEVAREADPVAQSVYLDQMSQLTGVPAATLAQSLPQATQTAPAPAVPDWQPGPPPPEAVEQAVPEQRLDRSEKAERELLALSFHDANLARRLHQDDFAFPDAQYQAIFDAWLSYAQASDEPTVAGFLDQIDPQLGPLVTTIDFRDAPQMPDEAIDDMILMVHRRQLTQESARVKQQMNQATQLGDKQTADAMLMQYIQLQRQLKAAIDNEL